MRPLVRAGTKNAVSRAVTTRLLMGLLMTASLAACGHARPRPVSVPAPEHLGCFRLQLGPYSPEMYWGGDDIFIHPPDLLEFVDQASNELLARDGARIVRPLRPSPGQSPTYGEWWRLEDGRIRLVWGDGFSDVEILLTKRESGYSGTAETYWDF